MTLSGSKKHKLMKITIEAQFPQCRQVYLFFTQGYFEFLYSEKERMKTSLVPILAMNYCSGCNVRTRITPIQSSPNCKLVRIIL